MSKIASPTHFKGELDHFYDPTFTADISQKMQVPKSIRVAGGDGDMDDHQRHNSWLNEKFDMHVPDRILVVGEEQHVGVRAPPREILMENAVMAAEPEPFVRVQTPPRTITLDEHYFPSVDDFPRNSPPEREMMNGKFDSGSISEANQITPFKSRQHEHDHSLLQRDWTPMPSAGGESITTGEEILHLRRQLAKLNRRVMAVELDNLQMQQREKMLYASVAAYLLYKIISWMSHNG
ncbi:hypothetical protein ONE63_004000 [Megalurothrips usitatus]|nr:hypothetical protein ONE63_004000 [Megalurothrips usitatus]